MAPSDAAGAAPRVIVSASRSTKLQPEIALVSLAAAGENSDKTAALEASARSVAAVRELVAPGAVDAPASWTSSALRVWVDRPWGPDGRRLDPVYHAEVDFSATFTDFSALSSWIVKAADAPGVLVNGVDWSLSDETRRAAESQVQAQAVHDAAAKAATYAEAAGLQIVGPIEIADQGLLGHEHGVAKFSEMRMAVADGVDLRPDEIAVSASVEIRYGARHAKSAGMRA